MNSASEDQGAAQCSICHDDFLTQPVCVLPCGHIYHADCVQTWLATSKSRDCPQCKKKSKPSDLRMLQFQMGEVSRESLSEVLRFQAAAEAERERYEVEFASEYQQAQEELQRVDKELEDVTRSTQEWKRIRRECLVPQQAEKEAVLVTARERLVAKSDQCALMQADLDKATLSQQHKLPIAPVRDDDPDAVEERKRLRTIMRPTDRALQLHQALLSGRKMYEETRGLKLDRLQEVEATEEELKRLRQQLSRLKRQQSERQVRQEDPVGAESSNLLRHQASERQEERRACEERIVRVEATEEEVKRHRQQDSNLRRQLSERQEELGGAESSNMLRRQASERQEERGASEARTASQASSSTVSVIADVGVSKALSTSSSPSKALSTTSVISAARKARSLATPTKITTAIAGSIDEDFMFGLEARKPAGLGIGRGGSGPRSGGILGGTARPVTGPTPVAVEVGARTRRIGGGMKALFARAV